MFKTFKARNTDKTKRKCKWNQLKSHDDSLMDKITTCSKVNCALFFYRSVWGTTLLIYTPDKRFQRIYFPFPMKILPFLLKMLSVWKMWENEKMINILVQKVKHMSLVVTLWMLHLMYGRRSKWKWWTQQSWRTEMINPSKVSSL